MSIALPTRLRKTNVARGVTATVALGAGIAMASTGLHTLDQAGSGSRPYDVAVQLDLVEQGDVTVNQLHFGEIAYLDPADSDGVTAADIDATNGITMTFVNEAADEAAVIDLTDITDRSAEGNDLYGDIEVRITASDDSVVYQGLLADIAATPRAMGTVPADGSLSFEVKAWTETKYENEDGNGVNEADWTVLYNYYGEDNPPVVDPPAPQNSNDVPDELDSDEQFEDGHDTLCGDGNQPSANPDATELCEFAAG